MMDVVYVYDIHHLTIEMMLKDRQNVSVYGGCAALRGDLQDRRKTKKMPKNQSSKTQNFEYVARRETAVQDAI